jgi:hypothetical protein
MIINNNDALVNLSGLENLKSMGFASGADGWDRIEIKGNDALESLQGIENIEPASMYDLVIQNNPLLSECAVKSICDYLTVLNHGANIDSNAVGCNNTAEVTEACIFGISGEMPEQDGFVVYPNPCAGAAHLRLMISDQQFVICDLFTISGIRLERLVSEVMLPGTYELEIGLSHLPAGIYIIKALNDKEVKVQKVIKQ